MASWSRRSRAGVRALRLDAPEEAGCLCGYSHRLGARTACVEWMLDLNILGLCLRAARKLRPRLYAVGEGRTTLASKVTTRLKSRSSSVLGTFLRGLGEFVREVRAARSASVGEGAKRVMAESPDTVVDSRDQAAVRSAGHGTPREFDDGHRKRRRSARRPVVASTETVSDADRRQRSADADYLRRLTDGERVGAAAHPGQRHASWRGGSARRGRRRDGDR